jgi:molybdenum cofactor guanylyltransferase
MTNVATGTEFISTLVIRTLIRHSCFDIRHFPALETCFHARLADPRLMKAATTAGEICILAGGLSARMGRDKARLRLGGKTLLRRVQDVAGQTKWPVRVIRRDLVERCGPLGGVYTALQTTAADSVLFLACDMPFVTVELLETLIDKWPSKTGAIFTRERVGGKAGFPFILNRDLLATVERQLAERRYSLQALAAACHAKIFTARLAGPLLFNVNTPDDWDRARKWAISEMWD